MHNFIVTSKFKDYSVALTSNYNINDLGTFFLIDSNVFDLLQEKPKRYIIIESIEQNKSFEYISNILKSLVREGIKRNDVLVGIGGGIVQDITAFISSIWMRGLKWNFIPTTLLAQCDSCIGSKSSINFNDVKNILGTFNSPDKVIIDLSFLNSLSEKEIKSGLGEIMKLLVIDCQEFNYEDLTKNLDTYIIKSLRIKKTFIEQDEFDVGIRNILNYGHCFGHAIESSTNYEIPHGIAVSLGMDIANRFSLKLNNINETLYEKYKEPLKLNYREYSEINYDTNTIIKYLKNDKKHTDKYINIIAPIDGKIKKVAIDNSDSSWEFIENVLIDFFGECGNARL